MARPKKKLNENEKKFLQEALKKETSIRQLAKKYALSISSAHIIYKNAKATLEKAKENIAEKVEEIKAQNLEAKSSILFPLEPNANDDKEAKKDYTQAQLAMKDALAKRALATYIICLKDRVEECKKYLHETQTEIDYINEFFPA